MLDLEKLENLPLRESRKEHLTRTYRNMYNLKRWDGLDNLYDKYWHMSKRIIITHVGKSFDEAYSKFRKQVPYNYKHAFVDQFRNFRIRSWWNPDYYINDLGIICKAIKNKHKRPIVLRSSNGELISFDSKKNKMYKRFIWEKRDALRKIKRIERLMMKNKPYNFKPQSND